MTYSVYQHWDPLKVMVVGKSYPPEIYDYIKNERVRKVFYKIAEETEEDYQKLIKLLESFNVSIVRPDIDSMCDVAKYHGNNNQVITSPNPIMQPRDISIMLGEKFYCGYQQPFKNVIELIESQGNTVVLRNNTNSHAFGLLNGAMSSRVGKDLIIGSIYGKKSINLNKTQSELQSKLPEYRVTMVDTDGHTDGTFCPVVPGLILSILSPITYAETFPNWEVVYLEGEAWEKVRPFLDLKKKNLGKWWVPGEELNQDFTDYVETWMNKWVGYVEESVFDVNMIAIDKKNVIVNGYNQKAFDAFSRYGITPHICNFRHRYFWDGGLHCITSDLHREGVMEDYFPERNQ